MREVAVADTYRELAADLGVLARENEPLAPYTWLRVGGPASWVFFPTRLPQAARLYAALVAQELPVRILGAGSNLVVADEGIRAAVIATSEMTDEPAYQGEGRVLAPAGTPVPGLARWAARHNLSGLEFSEGIPALFGGALRMNAGAHGSHFGAVVESVLVGGADGTVQQHPAVAGDFEYRHTFIQDRKLIALGAIVRLAQDDPEAIKTRMLEYRRRRRETQPVQERSAGCVFANFPGLPVGRLVEELGLKGTSIGDAEVSTLHGNFIINRGRATATDILALVDLVSERIVQATGQVPRREVEVWRDPS